MGVLPISIMRSEATLAVRCATGEPRKAAGSVAGTHQPPGQAEGQYGRAAARVVATRAA